jgi:hypothetical protein
VESVGEALNWRVRPGRARPAESALVIVVVALVFPFMAWLLSFPVALFLLIPVGLYVAGPLWVPVSYRVDDEGVPRTTPFGAATHPWKTLGPYRVDRGRRSAWIARQGRGTARFLPPLLLLWEDREGSELRPRLEQLLETHLGRRLPA